MEKSRKELPFVLVNMAMTADGKIATANRRFSSFGSQRDKHHLYELRATADAVMAGARTIDLNRVTLGPGTVKYRRLRISRGLAQSNLRIVVSRSGSVNPDAELFKHKFSPIILLTTKRVSARRLERLRPLVDEIRVCGEQEINFYEALRWLRSKWNIRRLLCEGGGEVNDALFRARLVDELHLTVCSLIFGGRNAPTIADGTGAAFLRQASRWKVQSARRQGKEMFFCFGRLRSESIRRLGCG